VDFIKVLIFSCGTLGLVLGNRGTGTSDLLGLVLGFLNCLAGLFLLLHKALTDKPVFWFELSHRLFVIVNQTKSGRLATSKLGSETKQYSQFGIGLVHASDNSLKLRLWHICSSRVDNVHNELTWEKNNVSENKLTTVVTKSFVLRQRRARKQKSFQRRERIVT
jgi:hypothetical protein